MTTPLADGYFTVGGVQFPLTATLSNSLLQDADPALYYMVKYYQGIFNLHLAPRWNACIVNAGLDGYIPSEVLPYDPFRNGLSQANAWRFPLLAIYPKGSSYKFETVSFYQIARNFEVLFCLPPLNSAQYEQLFPFLQLAEKVIVDRTLAGFDSNFNSSELVWKESGLEKISVVSSNIGNIPFPGQIDMSFPTLMMTLTVFERRMPDIRGFDPLTGFDTSIIGVGNE